jgi:hypothetical protein
LHITAASDTTPCDDLLDALACTTLDVTGDSSSVQYIYILATGVEDSLLGAAFGIDYPGSTVHIPRWHPCTDATELPWLGAWPLPGSEIGFGWDPAEPALGPDGIVVLGALEVLRGGDGVLGIIVGPELGFAEITTTVKYYDLRFGGHLGIVDVGGFEGFGYNPCDPLTPVESHSWSTIKALYK